MSATPATASANVSLLILTTTLPRRAGRVLSQTKEANEMATVHETLAQPVQQAGDTIGQAATALGWAFDARASGVNLLVFTKGATPLSWGSGMRVSLQPGNGLETRLTLTTSEVFALTDWGRGKRAIGRLLTAIGAQQEI